MSAKEHDDQHDHEHDHGHDHGHDHVDGHGTTTGRTITIMAGRAPRPCRRRRSTATGARSRELDGKAPFQTEPGASNEFATAPSRAIDPLPPPQLLPADGRVDGARRRRRRCRYEKEEIVPLARRPEGQVPGQTQQYATAFELGGVGQRAASRPRSRAARSSSTATRSTRSRAAASSPAPSATPAARRSRRPRSSTSTIRTARRTRRSGGKGASMDAFRAALAGARARARPAPACSARRRRRRPSRALKQRLVADGRGLARVRAAVVGQRARGHCAARSVARCARSRASTRPRRSSRSTATCSSSTRPRCATAATSRAAAGSHGSLGIGKMNRLWSVESTFSNTGAMADHRLGAALASSACRSRWRSTPRSAVAAAPAVGVPQGEEGRRVPQASSPRSCRQNTGRAVVVAGRRQPPEVHALVAQDQPDARRASARRSTTSRIRIRSRASHLAVDHAARAGHATAGRVQTLIILGGNPVYDAPADLDFAGAAREGADLGPPPRVRRTRPRRRRRGTCRARTSSRRGATRARGTARSRSRSR